jgi:hypothetical protein
VFVVDLNDKIKSLILKPIQDQTKKQITGKNQHGLKKNSTMTMGILLQSMITRALDKSNSDCSI